MTSPSTFCCHCGAKLRDDEAKFLEIECNACAGWYSPCGVDTYGRPFNVFRRMFNWIRYIGRRSA
jgi:hypothetical protein